MTKRVQLAGGPTATEAFLVGLERELRVDLDNDSLRLHDGVKEGGYEFLNRDASDNRYQFHSAELDGFSFGAQEKGLLVRVGPARYKIRKITSLSGDLTLTNIRGTAGDFDFRISDEVTTPHLWSGVQTFEQRIDAQDGISGDSYGVHHGNVIGDVTGNLTGDAVGNHSGSFTGDVDVSGGTIIFSDGQIPEAALDPQILIDRGVPQGAILMWSGTVDLIPESWALCDGDNGTPDLRNRFIYGAGDGTGYKAPGSSGGPTNVTLSGTIELSGDHSHPLDVDGHALTVDELPAHQHGNGICNGNSSPYNHGTIAAVPPAAKDVHDGSSTDAHLEGLTTETGSGDAHTHTGNTTDSGAHTHDLTLDDATVMPPYYALCYIMKIV